VVLTTPNAECNAVFENFHAGQFRHDDHRFEWSRQQFEKWAEPLAERSGYQVQFEPVGPVEEQYGTPTQMAIFTLA